MARRTQQDSPPSRTAPMTFREFWPLYLQAHSRRATRAVHYCATVIGLGSALAALLLLAPLFLLGIAIGYGFAICSLVAIENFLSMIRVNPFKKTNAKLWMFW